MGFSLGTDIDHMCLSALIEMGQAALVVFMHGIIRFRVHG
jgi:hypothetical protein